jgi:alpha-beta hydrolase superfamily lysophospholipase
MSTYEVKFPVGYYPFHARKVFNYQLNRWYSIGLADYDDCVRMGKEIKNFQDWTETMTRYAERAEKEGRLLNAAAYYRSSEFYTTYDVARKNSIYDKFTQVFYKAVEDENFSREMIPFENANIPILRFDAVGPKKGTVLIHGGFDAFVEEWFFILKYLSQNGFEAIGFEGPGQGHMLLKQGVPLDYRWERPVKAILDHYGIQEAAIFGLSMGGWFCLRAAAFEPRIKYVVASGHAIDYSRIPPAFARAMMMFFIKHMRNYTADSFVKVSRKQDIQGWQTQQLAHITKKLPLEAFEYSLNLNAANLHCEQIKQDVLYFSGQHDHYVPIKMHKKQVALLKNVKSLEEKVFTKREHADNHCQVGNLGLMLQDVTNWLTRRMGEGRANEING